MKSAWRLLLAAGLTAGCAAAPTQPGPGERPAGADAWRVQLASPDAIVAQYRLCLRRCDRQPAVFQRFCRRRCASRLP